MMSGGLATCPKTANAMSRPARQVRLIIFIRQIWNRI
jgi:hypothetical protein